MRSLLLEAELAPINSDIQKQNLKIDRLQNKTESKNEFKKSPLTIFFNNFLFIKETNEDQSLCCFISHICTKPYAGYSN